MHHMLRERYRRRAVIAESTLFAAAVVFCATTFAGKFLYEGLHLNVDEAQLWLGIASVAALIASTLLLIIDWKGAAARHTDAAEQWSKTVALFRRHRAEDGSWPIELAHQMEHSYWDAGRAVASIPASKFNALKAKYLLKVEISRRTQQHPGAPRILHWLMVRFKGMKGAIQENAHSGAKASNDD